MTATHTAATDPAGIAARVRGRQAANLRAVFARVIDLQGFSTWSADELVAVSETSEQAGDLLGRCGG